MHFNCASHSGRSSANTSIGTACDRIAATARSSNADHHHRNGSSPMKKPKRKIPGSIEWSGYKDDLDVRHAHKLFFGKPISEVQQYFGGTHRLAFSSPAVADEALH